MPLPFALLAACAPLPASPAAPIGDWGGRHVRLTLTSAGGTLEYDCAEGTMSGPLILDGKGNFTAEGTHTPGSGGPEIAGRVRPAYRARYTGTLRGDTMRLQARVENGVLLGPFTLRRGAEATIFRCL